MNTTVNKYATDKSEAARIAAEISKIEAELEKKRLEQEIAKMQAAINAQKQNGGVTKKKKVPKRKAPVEKKQVTPKPEQAPTRPTEPTSQPTPKAKPTKPKALDYRVNPAFINELSSKRPQYEYVQYVQEYPESLDGSKDYEEEIIEEEFYEEEIIEDDEPVIAAAPTMVPKNNLISSIAQAATSREQRLEENGGRLQMKEYEPEVAEQQRGPQQLSFSMAEMVTKKALARDKRLAEGGEKKMTKVKEKEEYKKDFSHICMEAASLGRLTRLSEHTIEAVAGEKTPEQAWRSQGLLAIQWRSNHMSVIHEAANYGNMIKMPEKVVSTCPEDQVDYDLEEIAKEKALSPRMRQLLQLTEEVGRGQHKVDSLVMGRKEENAGGPSLLVKPMVCYASIDDVRLPKSLPPKIDPEKAKERLSKMAQEAHQSGKPLLAISNDVAERAWERRTRLDRPGSLPKVREHCDCPYCIDPSPYQTFAYKELERKERLKSMYLEEKKQQEEEQRRREREARRLERKKRMETRKISHNDGVALPETSNHTSAPGAINGKPPMRKKRPSQSLKQKKESVQQIPKPVVPPPSPPPIPEPVTTDSGCSCVIL